MSGTSSYIRKTLVGGILVVLPLVLFVNLVIWLGEWIGNQASPVAALLASEIDTPLWVGKALGILAALGICFAVGAFVSNRLVTVSSSGSRVARWAACQVTRRSKRSWSTSARTIAIRLPNPSR